MRKVVTLVSLALLFVFAVVSARSLVLAHSKVKASTNIQSTAASPTVESSEVDPAAPAADCPNIRRAVGALETALHDLETARHDFCGHKKQAMDDTRRALDQLRKAEACDQCR